MATSTERQKRSATLLILIAANLVVLAIGALFSGLVDRLPRPLSLCLVAATGCASLCGVVLSVMAMRRSTTGGGMVLAALTALGGLFGLLCSAWCTLFLTGGHGRPYRRRGRPQFAPIQASDDCLVAHPVRASSSDAIAAAAWRRHGLAEHASITAFRHLAAELLALGAPPQLIRQAREDAFDEVRHAEVCFALACSLDGQMMTTGPLPVASGGGHIYVRRFALAWLATTALIDGALGEGVSARILAEVAREADEPGVRAALAGMARDEARHAGHAWGVVRWCLDEGGVLVAAAVEAALPVIARAPAPDAASASADLERFGLAERAQEHRVHECVRRRVVERARRILTTRTARDSGEQEPRGSATRRTAGVSTRP